MTDISFRRPPPRSLGLSERGWTWALVFLGCGAFWSIVVPATIHAAQELLAPRGPEIIRIPPPSERLWCTTVPEECPP